MIASLRHLRDRLRAPHINWLKTHLAPPFHFAVTTTIPHLPFADGYFGLIYCGSLFTHIDDLAEAWFMECRRVLAPGGLLYCILHDVQFTSHPVPPTKPKQASGYRTHSE